MSYKKDLVFEIISERDILNRCSFFINWIEPDGKQRSQIFFAVPEDYGYLL